MLSGRDFKVGMVYGICLCEGISRPVPPPPVQGAVVSGELPFSKCFGWEVHCSKRGSESRSQPCRSLASRLPWVCALKKLSVSVSCDFCHTTALPSFPRQRMQHRAGTSKRSLPLPPVSTLPLWMALKSAHGPGLPWGWDTKVVLP